MSGKRGSEKNYSASRSRRGEAQKGASAAEGATATTPRSSYVETLSEALQILHKASSSDTQDARHTVKVMRSFSRLRHFAVSSALKEVLTSVFGTQPISESEQQLWLCVASALESLSCEDVEMETGQKDQTRIEKTVDGDNSMNDQQQDEKQTGGGEKAAAWRMPAHGFSESRPNVEVFLCVLLVVRLIDLKEYETAVGVSHALIQFVKSLPRRGLDEMLSAKAYFYFSRSYELNGNIQDVRQELMEAYRLAVLHRDNMKQAVTLNCLLRNCLHCSHYDLAIKLVSKASLPEGLRSNSQTARYLYYLGRLQAVQQDYSDSHASLMEAVRKAPQPAVAPKALQKAVAVILPAKAVDPTKDSATDRLLDGLLPPDDDDQSAEFDGTRRTTTNGTTTATNPRRPPRAKGFRLSAYKFAMVVELLMGGIPDRDVFNQRDLRQELSPYKSVVDVVRSGDLVSFRRTLETFRDRFEKDGTLFLIQRLHRNVIRTGIRTISLSYSQISMVDVAQKLGLESAEEAEGVASKAVVDGVIDAVIDHNAKCLRTKPAVDLYTSNEPSEAFHKRIAFCLQLHNEAVEAMQYPQDNTKSKDKSSEAEARRKEVLDQLARAEEAEDDDDADML